MLILPLMLLAFLGACSRRKTEVTLHASLIQIYDNFSEEGKPVEEEKYSRKIHMVFRIFNFTNDSLYIPLFTIGGGYKSTIYYWIDGEKDYSYDTIYTNSDFMSARILPPQEFINLGINVYERNLPNKNVSLDWLRGNINFKYVVDDVERKEHDLVVPEIVFTTNDSNVRYFYEDPNRYDPI